MKVAVPDPGVDDLMNFPPAAFGSGAIAIGDSSVPDSASNGKYRRVEGIVGSTLNINLVVPVAMPSSTVRVMNVLPNWPKTGVTVTVLLESDPPKTMLPSGTNSGFEDVAERVSKPAGKWASLIVKEIGSASII